MRPAYHFDPPLSVIPEALRAEGIDAFQTTLNPTGVPNRAGIDNLVRSLQAQGRFTDRKVNFAEVADERPATEVAKELGYK